MADCMFHAQNMYKSIWVNVLANAFYTQNQCPKKALDSIMLEKMWCGKKTYIVHMHVLRCITYAMVAYDKGMNSMQKTPNLCF